MNRSTFAIMGIATTELTPVEQTAFLTVYARALDSRRPRPILADTLADEVVGRIDYDFAGLGVQTSVVCQAVLRAKMLDDRVRAFVGQHPDAVVVDLGAGLDSGVYRVSPPPSVDWYSVDLPGITALRDQVLPANPHSHSVPASLADEHWADTIPADRPTILVADGLFAFLTEPVIVAIVRRITDHFGSGELTFNDYGRIGPVSRAAVKLYPEDVQGRRKPVGLPGFQGRPPSRDLEPAAAAGRGGQPGPRTRGRPVPRLDSRGHPADGQDQGGRPQGAHPAVSLLARRSNRPDSPDPAAPSGRPSTPTTASPAAIDPARAW